MEDKSTSTYWPMPLVPDVRAPIVTQHFKGSLHEDVDVIHVPLAPR